MDAQEVLNRIVEEGFKPRAEAIAEIIAHGDIAVVVWEPKRELVAVLERDYGWKGEPVFRMRTKQRKTLAVGLEKMGDKAAARWFAANRRKGRIFLSTGPCSTLLINFTPGKGYSIEPGTTDAERKLTMN